MRRSWLRVRGSGGLSNAKGFRLLESALGAGVDSSRYVEAGAELITLITGTPGAGKSLRLVQLLMAAVKEGRPCYADINGLSVPGVHPSPDDWRECPDGSFIVYDECQKRWPSTGKPGRSGNPIIESLDTHRHRGMDFLLATQQPTLVHHEVRGYTGEHHHIARLAGAESGTIFKWPHVCTSPNDRQERSTADSEVWRYPKELYSVYASSSVHTSAYRFRLPTKVKLALVVAGVIAAFVGWRVSASNSMLGKLAGGGGEPSSVAPAPAAVSSSSSVVSGDVGWVGAVGGCIASVRACRCFDTKGQPLIEVQDHQCRKYVVDPLYQPVRLSTSKGDA